MASAWGDSFGDAWGSSWGLRSSPEKGVISVSISLSSKDAVVTMTTREAGISLIDKSGLSDWQQTGN